MKKNKTIAFRCKTEVREQLKRVSESLSVSEPEIARIALFEGLKIVESRGIQPTRSEEARR